MAHLAGKQFMRFLGLLAAGDVQENAGHRALHDARVVALAARRYPAHLITDHDAEIDLV